MRYEVIITQPPQGSTLMANPQVENIAILIYIDLSKTWGVVSASLMYSRFPRGKAERGEDAFTAGRHSIYLGCAALSGR